MWLSDYVEAIKVMQEVFGDTCFMSICSSYDGSAIIFKEEMQSDESYVYYRKTGRIIKTYKDTWRNPEHHIVIKEGK